MKRLFFVTGLVLLLHGCYSNANFGLGTAVGNNGIVRSNVWIGSDGRLYGNVGLGRAFRL